jgi:hypothetical protein
MVSVWIVRYGSEWYGSGYAVRDSGGVIFTGTLDQCEEWINENAWQVNP